MTFPRVRILPPTLLAALAAASFATASAEAHTTTREAPRGAATARIAAVAGEPAAERYAVGSAGWQTAMGVATSYWGATPCSGDVQAAWTALGNGTNAQASWSNPTDVWANPTANFACSIEFNAGEDLAWEDFCTVMVHEIGHLRRRGAPQRSLTALGAAVLTGLYSSSWRRS